MTRRLERRVSELEDERADEDDRDAVEQWRAYLRGEPSPWSPEGVDGDE